MSSFSDNFFKLLILYDLTNFCKYDSDFLRWYNNRDIGFTLFLLKLLVYVFMVECLNLIFTIISDYLIFKEKINAINLSFLGYYLKVIIIFLQKFLIFTT